MTTHSSLATSDLRRLSSYKLLKPSSQNPDDTFAGATSLGTLRASSSPVTFRFRNKLSKSDRNDYVKLEIASGAAFSSITSQAKITGGKVKATSYFELPGSTPRRATAFNYAPGTNSQVSNSPFSNVFGRSVILYLQVSSLSPSKNISYNFKITFKP